MMMRKGGSGSDLAGEIAGRMTESASAFVGGLERIAIAAGDFAGRSLERTASAAETLASSTSPEHALKAQGDFAMATWRESVAQATRMSGLFADLARDVGRPFESIVARPR